MVVLEQERLHAASLERPALTVTGDGRWRLYVSCATPGSKHWRIELLEASRPDRPGEGDTRTVFPGDELTAVDWAWHDAALTPRDGAWDARGVRVTAVLPSAAYYDGRASRDENFRERTGLAEAVATRGLATARLRANGKHPIADVRYVDAVREPDGGLRLFYEAPRSDGAHELRAQP